MTRLIDEANLIIAETTGTALTVYRSPIVTANTRTFKPAQDYIQQHGLVLAMSEKFEDPDWMFGEFVAEVYTVPNERADIMDAEPHSDMFEACGVCDHVHDLDTKHYMTEPDGCTDCIGFHRG